MKSFTQFLAFRAATVTPSTLRTYESDSRRFLEWCADRGLVLETITRLDIQQWMTEARAELKASVIKSRLLLIRSFFSWAVAEGLRTDNPVDLKRLPRLRSEKPNKQPFTESQYHQILDIARQYGADYWPDAISIAWHTALRMSDVAGLGWSAVDLPNRQLVNVRVQKKAQLGETLEIPMSDDLHDLLLRRWSSRETGSEWVHPQFHFAYEYSQACLSTQFGRLCDRAGLPGHTFHSLRHGAATRMINAGVDSIIVSSITGQSLEVLKGYSHVSMEAKRAAMSAGLQKKENAA